MGSAAGEFRQSPAQSVNGMLGEQDCITGGLRELLDTGCHVDGVTDQGEFELSPPPMVPAITTPVLIPMPIRIMAPNRSVTRR